MSRTLSKKERWNVDGTPSSLSGCVCGASHAVAPCLTCIACVDIEKKKINRVILQKPREALYK